MSSEEVRIIDVESGLDGISVGRFIRQAAGGGTFEVAANIREIARDGDTLSVAYALSFETSTRGQKAEMKGRASIKFSRLAPANDMASMGEELMNDVAVEIFRRNYQAVYLLHDALGLEAPSPWVTRRANILG